jgi:hypothetical protein
MFGDLARREGLAVKAGKKEGWRGHSVRIARQLRGRPRSNCNAGGTGPPAWG